MASLFPGNPLLVAPQTARFAAVEVPWKGWRLMLTSAGLASCGHIVVHATGAAKVLRPLAVRTTWLLDPAAVAECPELRNRRR